MRFRGQERMPLLEMRRLLGVARAPDAARTLGVRTLAGYGHAPHEDVVAQIDRVVMLRDGAIVADGAKRDLMTGDALSQLFDVPLTVEERDGGVQDLVTHGVAC